MKSEADFVEVEIVLFAPFFYCLYDSVVLNKRDSTWGELSVDLRIAAASIRC
jgi:hypothetical protein